MNNRRHAMSKIAAFKVGRAARNRKKHSIKELLTYYEVFSNKQRTLTYFYFKR